MIVELARNPMRRDRWRRQPEYAPDQESQEFAMWEVTRQALSAAGGARIRAN
jgi:hypothetical protein